MAVIESGFATGDRIYVDSNASIYLTEDAAQKGQAVNDLFSEIAKAGAILLSSELTLAECLYKPARDKDERLLAVYEHLFEFSGDINLVPLTGTLVKQAVFVGVEQGLKLLDAIHYASAVNSGCKALVTGDSRFKSSPHMRVIVV